MWFNLKTAKYEKDIVVDTPEIIKYDNMSWFFKKFLV
jgi:hypothetical protein